MASVRSLRLLPRPDFVCHESAWSHIFAGFRRFQYMLVFDVVLSLSKKPYRYSNQGFVVFTQFRF